MPCSQSKEKGLVRYVGATTHNRAIALDLIESDRCELLMHRYNMAHRKAEEQVRFFKALSLLS